MENKVITYSLLACINNQSAKGSSFESIFNPLVKRALSRMCSTGQFKGDDISDIKKHVDDLYSLNMPVSVLKKILVRISEEINTKEKEVLQFYSGGSFIIRDYVFDDYEEEINKRTEVLNRLNTYYSQFLKTENTDTDKSIFEFVEENKHSIGKYIGHPQSIDNADYTVAARFVNFIQPIEDAYSALKSVYIGAIISTYLEYEPSKIQKNVELLFDTNFVISLLDLNTKSSKDNCVRLLDISKQLGYRFSVLPITIREIDQLLKSRVEMFDTSFLSMLVDPEDIYNACQRRSLSKTDLDRIRSNVEFEVKKFGIVIVPYTEKFELRAQKSSEYERLKGVRNTSFAALHDATCIEYIKDARGKLIYEFDKVNCWFVNNSSSRRGFFTGGVQPYSIKAEDLLNLLWLASPMVKSQISADELGSIGLARLVSTTLDDSLPKLSTIKELDANIQKYAKDNISDEDVVWVAKSIAERTLSNLDGLNDLAESNSGEFVSSLQGIANDQKKKAEEVQNLLNKLIKGVEGKLEELNKESIKIKDEREQFHSIIQVEKNKQQESIEATSVLIEKNKRVTKENIDLKNSIRKNDRDKFIRRSVFLWRVKSFLTLLVGPIFLLVSLWYINHNNGGNWELSKVFIKNLLSNQIIYVLFSLASLGYTAILIPIFVDKYKRNTVTAFRNDLDIPEAFKDLKIDDEGL